MLNHKLNVFKTHPSSDVFVLRDHTPEEVAQAMILGGRQKQPFYIFDMDEMYRRVQHFRNMLPRVKICYAMKSNDSVILKLAVALGIGFDCSSPGEIYKILQLGVKPTSIIYAVPTKTNEQIMYARSCGVRNTMFDTSYELTKIKQYWPDARLLLRIKVDGNSVYKFGDKFGCKYETDAINLLNEAADLQLREMLNHKLNVFKTHPSSDVFVLRDHTPEEVAQAMILGGRQKQPFYIFDMDEMYRRVQHFRNMLPRVKICYAMKSNDSVILKLAVALGIGFDCSSPGEIYKILQLGVKPTSIIYAVPTKTNEQIMYARSCGVRNTMFDTSYELTKIKQYWPDARLLLRIKVDGNSVYKFGDKFGCKYETDAINLLNEAADLQLRVIGVAFHVGSYCSSTDTHVIGLKCAKALFDYEKSKGRTMKIIDIGGGFYSDDSGKFDVVCNEINRALDSLFPDSNEVQILAEPGRYLCGTAFTLYCNINNVKTIKKGDKFISSIYMNDGIYGTLHSFEPWYTVEKFERSCSDMHKPFQEIILWGNSIDSNDRVTLAHKVLMQDCTVEDWLVFKRQGAYTLCAVTQFGNLESPTIRPVVSYDLWTKIKQCPVFKPLDFDVNPDISTPLPLSMPPVLNIKKKKEI